MVPAFCNRDELELCLWWQLFYLIQDSGGQGWEKKKSGILVHNFVQTLIHGVVHISMHNPQVHFSAPHVMCLPPIMGPLWTPEIR